MKKINIEIPDNLTPEAEVLAIAKQLSKKQISQKQNLQIGHSLEVKELQTQITITRVSKEKVIKMVVCSLCNTQYQKTKGKRYYTDYGGTRKQKTVCSDECLKIVLESFPGRTSTNYKKIQPMQRFW